MKALLSIPAFLLPLALSACGAAPDPPRQLVSITITPSSADAANYPNGQVPFVATGHYNTAPYTTTPLSATWGTSDINGLTLIQQNGTAVCPAGYTGTIDVAAWVLDNPPPRVSCDVIGYGGDPVCSAVTGLAQLVCP